MKKNKIILIASSLIVATGLANCANSRDIKPQYNIVFANCYSKDRTGADARTEKDWRVFPDWAYPIAEEEEPWYYDSDTNLTASLKSSNKQLNAAALYQIPGLFGYVGTGDKGNEGTFTVDGKTEFQLGDDLDFTLTLDEFVILNPIDGNLVRNPEAPEDSKDPKDYTIENPVYFKIYVSENSTYSYNELKRDYYTVKVDESNPSVIHFHIPGKYTKFSYRVYFSSSYLDVTDYGFNGFNTAPYDTLGREAPTEYEKSVPYTRRFEPVVKGSNRLVTTNTNYVLTNSKVGKDLACVITPIGMNGGLTFSDDYLQKLQFFGFPVKSKGKEVQPVDITSYVHKNLIHYYANVPNIEITDFDRTSNQRIFPTNQYRCRVTFPWINKEHPEGGLFKFSNNEYTLNYEGIYVTVQEKYSSDKIPFYLQKDEIKSKFKINADSNIASSTYDYDLYSPNLRSNAAYVPAEFPSLLIDVIPNVGYEITDNSISSIKITSKTSPTGNKYFRDVNISDSDNMHKAVFGDPDYDYVYGYVTKDNVDYYFLDTFNIYKDIQDNKALVVVNLESLLRRISFGPTTGNYSYLDTSIIEPAGTNTVTGITATVTLDMIESIELGLMGIESSTQRF